MTRKEQRARAGASPAGALDDLRRAATRRGRRQLGAFAVEGARLLRRGVRAGYEPRRVWIARSVAAELERGGESLAELRALLEGVRPVQVAEDEALLELSQGRASGKVSALFELPPERSLGELARAGERSLVLVLVDVREPGNVGALVRTALAAGATAVLAVGQSDPFHPKAVRTSLGSLFKMPLAWCADAASAQELLADCGLVTVAAVARGGEPLHLARIPQRRRALLVGNEGAGLDDQCLARADRRVTIELSGEADSFCVNAAAAVCLFELRREELTAR